MNTLSAPKNLTRNVLIGMGLGILIASIFYYSQNTLSQSLSLGIEKYVFNFFFIKFNNFLFLVFVRLVFFFLLCVISYLSYIFLL